jgi:hypothetical protein
LQKDRASTVDSEKILRLTKSITHMHRVRFVAKPPEVRPDAHIYFITPAELQHSLLPVNTYTMYLLAPIPSPLLGRVIEELPHDATIIDYAGNSLQRTATLLPKQIIEQAALEQWQAVETYFSEHGIDHAALVNRGVSSNFRAVDDALDILLGVAHTFLQIAGNFQHCFELAQPFALPGAKQREYEIFLLLAHQVRSLSPAQHLASGFAIDATNQSETFFLHDAAVESILFADVLANSAAYHRQAGRHRLARALAFAGYS